MCKCDSTVNELLTLLQCGMQVDYNHSERCPECNETLEDRVFAGWALAQEEANKCSCGSGEQSYWEYDGRGIELEKCCSKCKRKKLAKYRPEIAKRYYNELDVDERIEPDD